MELRMETNSVIVGYRQSVLVIPAVIQLLADLEMLRFAVQRMTSVVLLLVNLHRPAQFATKVVVSVISKRFVLVQMEHVRLIRPFQMVPLATPLK